jgi:TonB dependent receptor
LLPFCQLLRSIGSNHIAAPCGRKRHVDESGNGVGILVWIAGRADADSLPKFPRYPQTTDSLAGYGPASYDFGEGMRLTLGGRYTWEQRDFASTRDLRGYTRGSLLLFATAGI